MFGPDGPVGSAEAGDAVTLTLAREVDVARGYTLSSPRVAPLAAMSFAADLIWLSDEALLPGRS